MRPTEEGLLDHRHGERQTAQHRLRFPPPVRGLPQTASATNSGAGTADIGYECFSDVMRQRQALLSPSLPENRYLADPPVDVP